MTESKLTFDEIAKAREVFGRRDRLTAKEDFREAFRELGLYLSRVSEADVDQLWCSFPLSGCTFESFLNVLQAVKDEAGKLPDDTLELVDAFTALGGRNGSCDALAFLNTIEAFGLKSDLQNLLGMIRKENGTVDCKIDFQEFQALTIGSKSSDVRDAVQNITSRISAAWKEYANKTDDVTLDELAAQNSDERKAERKTSVTQIVDDKPTAIPSTVSAYFPKSQVLYRFKRAVKMIILASRMESHSLIAARMLHSIRSPIVLPTDTIMKLIRAGKQPHRDYTPFKRISLLEFQITQKHRRQPKQNNETFEVGVRRKRAGPLTFILRDPPPMSSKKKSRDHTSDDGSSSAAGSEAPPPELVVPLNPSRLAAPTLALRTSSSRKLSVYSCQGGSLPGGPLISVTPSRDGVTRSSSAIGLAARLDSSLERTSSLLSAPSIRIPPNSQQVKTITTGLPEGRSDVFLMDRASFRIEVENAIPQVISVSAPSSARSAGSGGANSLRTPTSPPIVLVESPGSFHSVQAASSHDSSFASRSGLLAQSEGLNSELVFETAETQDCEFSELGVPTPSESAADDHCYFRQTSAEFIDSNYNALLDVLAGSSLAHGGRADQVEEAEQLRMSISNALASSLLVEYKDDDSWPSCSTATKALYGVLPEEPVNVKIQIPKLRLPNTLRPHSAPLRGPLWRDDSSSTSDTDGPKRQSTKKPAIPLRRIARRTVARADRGLLPASGLFDSPASLGRSSHGPAPFYIPETHVSALKPPRPSSPLKRPTTQGVAPCSPLKRPPSASSSSAPRLAQYEDGKAGHRVRVRPGTAPLVRPAQGLPPTVARWRTNADYDLPKQQTISTLVLL